LVFGMRFHLNRHSTTLDLQLGRNIRVEGDGPETGLEPRPKFLDAHIDHHRIRAGFRLRLDLVAALFERRTQVRAHDILHSLPLLQQHVTQRLAESVAFAPMAWDFTCALALSAPPKPSEGVLGSEGD